MGWVWVNDDDDYNTNRISSFGNDDVEFRASSSPYANEITGPCATRKIEASQCRTEEVVPGKFIRRCDKAEQVFKDCIGRPIELIRSNEECSEEDVTNQMTSGSFPFKSAEHGPFSFPGLRRDLEAIKPSFIDSIARFFLVDKGMTNDFSNSAGSPHNYDNDAPSHDNRGIYIEDHPPEEAFQKKLDGGDDLDFSYLSKGV